MVLLHFCFNQQEGETKREWCPCNQRISRDEAFSLVRENFADWLLVKNPRAASGVAEFHRAVVVRSLNVNGEKLYAVEPSRKLSHREVKHEAIKQEIRNSARRLFQQAFSKGLVSQVTLDTPDAELDELLGDGHKTETFLTDLRELGQTKFADRFARIIERWWNDILSYHRLNVNAGQYLKQAERGKGQAVSGGNDSEHMEDIDGQHKADTGRVSVANYRPCYWNGAWDYSRGAAPNDKDGNARLCLDGDEDVSLSLYEETEGDMEPEG